MSNFLSLIQNEQMKIYSRARTWIMLVILVLVVILWAVMLKYVIDSGLNSMFSFVSMSTSLSTLVFIFTVIVAGDSVASEFTWGTIKLLLIRPATRSKILASKYISVVLFLITLLLILLIASYFVGLIFFGLGGLIPEQESFTDILKTYGFKSIDLLMSITLAFMISAAFRSSSLAIGLSFLLMFVTSSGLIFVLAQFKYTWVKYLLFANTDLSIYQSSGKPLVEGMTLGFSVLMLAAYWVLFYAVSWLFFTKRDIAG
ncbi:ABC-2 type transport system permease protein [Paenibacillus sp. 1_12]|uniref:ABC transporter permease n=1 Tax=Paenibacillus sp. 1_12 TaxID=1566278 RepID=UPI0008E8A342|nr:ABC transporter permease [Paenibacillus sp. 1_12]SFL12113.1 ABC-2 type transport system permease protein [Paenibacillus sp. 1_12]